MTEDAGQQVLQLVIPYLKSRIMQCRCSLVSQHFKGYMQTYVRQHLANLLTSYLVTRWAEDSDIKPLMSTREKLQSIKWLATTAGPDALGRPDVAKAVLMCHFGTAATSAAPMLAAAGLRLTDQCVRDAAAARAPYCSEIATVVLRATPRGRLQQQLSTLMIFACTAVPETSLPPKMLEGRPAQELADFLLVLVNNRQHLHIGTQTPHHWCLCCWTGRVPVSNKGP